MAATICIVIECQHECTSLARLVCRCNEEQVNVDIRMVKPVAGTTTRLHPSDESRSLTVGVETSSITPWDKIYVTLLVNVSKMILYSATDCVQKCFIIGHQKV